MDENEFRTAYHSINDIRCVFEKSLLTLNCQCSNAEKLNIAEREGIRCSDESAQQTCKKFLDSLRQQARFALGLTEIVGNLLPHSKEIQVQKGGLLGLTPDLPNLPDTPIENIAELMQGALHKYGDELQDLPYQQLMSSIVHHPPRPRRRKRRDSRS